MLALGAAVSGLLAAVSRHLDRPAVRLP